MSGESSDVKLELWSESKRGRLSFSLSHIDIDTDIRLFPLGIKIALSACLTDGDGG